VNSEHGYAAKRTALFLRMLAEEMVPQNKLWELVQQLRAQAQYDRMPEDFTGKELAMAAMLGPTGKEIDEACADRIAQYKQTAEELRKRTDGMSEYWRASDSKADAFRHEADHLREAFKALGVVPPEVVPLTSATAKDTE